jgi:hypothetical protein
MSYAGQLPAAVGLGFTWELPAAYRRDMYGRLDADQQVIACLNKANASSEVTTIDNTVYGLAKNWHPTGYFRPAEVQQVLTMLRDAAADAGSALASVGTGMLDIEQVRSLKRQAVEDVARAVIDRSKAYHKSIADAQAAGVNVINAPAFKDFVIKALRSISDAYVTASVIECIAGGLLRVLNRGYKVMVGIGAVVARMGGVVIRVGEAVIDAVDTAGSIAAKIIKYAPYAAAGIGAYLLYNFVKSKAR